MSGSERDISAAEQRPAILALDSAMSGCSAAVTDRHGQCFAETMPMTRGQSEHLVPMMDRVMRRAAMSYDELALVAVTVGPGAFTGLRIGLAAARALGVALGIPVTGVSTAEALARQYAPQAQGRFGVLLETKREDFYIQFFSKDGLPLCDPAGCAAADIAARLEPGDALIGDALERFRAAAGTVSAAMIDGFVLPDPAVMAAIAFDQLRSGTLKAADPLYLREADVSVAKNKPRAIEGITDEFL